MIKPATQDAIKEMHKRNMAIKTIANTLGLSKNSVKSVLRGKHAEPKAKISKYHQVKVQIPGVDPRH